MNGQASFGYLTRKIPWIKLVDIELLDELNGGIEVYGEPSLLDKTLLILHRWGEIGTPAA